MQPDPIMSQWVHMSHMLPFLSDQTINELYPPATFPIEARHFLAEWIESQRWYETHTDTHIAAIAVTSIRVCVAHREDFMLENVEQEPQARNLFDQAISTLQTLAQQNSNVVDRMKLMQIGRKMVRKRMLSSQTCSHLVLNNHLSLCA